RTERGGAAVRGVLGGGLVRVPDRGVPPPPEHARVGPGGGAGRGRRDGGVPAVVPGPPALPRLLRVAAGPEGLQRPRRAAHLAVPHEQRAAARRAGEPLVRPRAAGPPRRPGRGGAL
ncbi:MAG: hypothetical protein AVDCRST_MAG79-1769, partial [uncultured Thermoleophilia bacterium]